MFEGAPSLAFVRRLFQLRMIVEPSAAEPAAVHRTGEQLRGMDDATAAVAHHGLADGIGREADRRLHAVMPEAVDNELSVSLSAGIGTDVHWTPYLEHRSSNITRDPVPEHRSLLQAITDPDAGPPVWRRSD